MVHSGKVRLLKTPLPRTLSLLQNGAIKLNQEQKCPLDEFELVLWSSGSKGKSYSICPFCYSNPPFKVRITSVSNTAMEEMRFIGCFSLVHLSFSLSPSFLSTQDMRKGQGCNQCTHPACKHSLNSLGVGECFECDSGVLVLDASSAPKWKLACNKCNLVVALFENAHKV